MSQEEFKTELKVRLLQNIYPTDSFCELCGDIMDRKGRHAAVCGCGGDRNRRHNGVRDRVCTFASAAHQNPEKETLDFCNLPLTSPTLLGAALPMFSCPLGIAALAQHWT